MLLDGPGQEARHEQPVTTTNQRERVRIYATGSCDGFDKLRDSLASHPELEVVGSSTTSPRRRQRSPAGTSTPSCTRPAARALPARRARSDPRAHAAPRSCSSPRAAPRGCSRKRSTPTSPTSCSCRSSSRTSSSRSARRRTRQRHEFSSAARPARQDRHGLLAEGRTGKTVTATNLAAACAKFEERKTLLLDLDLQFGDAAIMLGIEPEKTIYDLVVAPGELDSEKLAGYTTKHACGARRPPGAAAPGGRRARHRGQARPAARGRTRVVTT